MGVIICNFSRGVFNNPNELMQLLRDLLAEQCRVDSDKATSFTQLA